MVAMSEIDSFIWKFKQLVNAGKNAHLDIKSEAGKAIVHLTAEVDAHADEEQQLAQPRNGPAWQRRREKRAAARDTAKIVKTAAAETAFHQVKVVENTNHRKASGEDTLKNVNTLKKSESEEKVAEEKAKSKSAENASNPVIAEVDDEFAQMSLTKPSRNPHFLIVQLLHQKENLEALTISRCFPQTTCTTEEQEVAVFCLVSFFSEHLYLVFFFSVTYLTLNEIKIKSKKRKPQYPLSNKIPLFYSKSSL
jgi:hypothetical protein